LFAINPHAGEDGLFGDDDDRITVPAAKRLQALGLNVEGPIGADLMLGRCDFDAFVAMYHDQGPSPVKLLAGRSSAALSICSPASAMAVRSTSPVAVSPSPKPCCGRSSCWAARLISRMWRPYDVQDLS
jgi:hypothetical protein